MTGGTGFIGRWIVKSLEDRGAEVVICSSAPAGRIGGNSVHADLLHEGQADRIVAEIRPDIIVHAAWCVEHGKFWTAPENLDWIAASLRLVRAAKTHGVRRFVGIGTCFEYAFPEQGDCSEFDTPLRPTTLYGIAKDALRRVIEEFAGNELEFAWTRPFYLFGPFEHPDRLAASVAIRLLQKQPAPLSSGTAIRDFMDVRDAGEALAMVALSPVQGAINIGSGVGMSIAQIAQAIRQAAGEGTIQIGALPDREGEPARIVADVGRLRREVGYAPHVDLRERLGETFRWWQERVGR